MKESCKSMMLRQPERTFLRTGSLHFGTVFLGKQSLLKMSIFSKIILTKIWATKNMISNSHTSIENTAEHKQNSAVRIYKKSQTQKRNSIHRTYVYRILLDTRQVDRGTQRYRGILTCKTDLPRSSYSGPSLKNVNWNRGSSK